jgi:hypothetical protein
MLIVLKGNPLASSREVLREMSEKNLRTEKERIRNDNRRRAATPVKETVVQKDGPRSQSMDVELPLMTLQKSYETPKFSSPRLSVQMAESSPLQLHHDHHREKNCSAN